MKVVKKLILYVLAVTLLLPLPGCESTFIDKDALEKYPQANMYENDWPPKGEDQIIMRVGFFRTPNATYYFTLSKNGVLEASRGCHMFNIPFEEMELYEIVDRPEFGAHRAQRRFDDRYHHHFEEDLVDMLGVVEEVDTYQLTRAEFDNIIEMLEMIQNIPDDRALGIGAFGSEIYWIYLNYNDTFFEFMYGAGRFRSDWEMAVIESFAETLFWHSPVQRSSIWNRRMAEIRRGDRHLDRWRELMPQGQASTAPQG